MSRHNQNTELLTAYALSVRLQTTMQDVFHLIRTGRVRTRIVGGERLIVWPALRLVVEEERAA